MYLLQGEQDTRNGRVKGSRKAGAGPAGNEQLFLGLDTPGQSGKSLGSHGSQLDAGALPPQGETASQGQDTAAQLGNQHPPPALVNLPNDFAFHLRYTASRNQ